MFFKPAENLEFGVRVEAAGGFVQNNQAGIPQERSCYGDHLPLADAQLHAPLEKLAKNGPVFAREPGYKMIGTGIYGGFFNAGNIRRGQISMFPNRILSSTVRSYLAKS